MLLKVCSQCGYEAIIKNCKSIKILSDKFVKWYDQYPQYLEDLALGSNLNQLLSNDLIQYELKETNSIDDDTSFKSDIIYIGKNCKLSVLIADELPDLSFVPGGQCFPLYYYDKNEGNKGTKFERLMKSYLQIAPEYERKFKEIWLKMEIIALIMH